MKAALIADDLTGALDVAGPFASRGHDTWAVVSHRGCFHEQLAGAVVLSVNCASRHLPAFEAAAVVRDVVERLGPAQAEILIKKIDSTLRGNVAAETLALATASGRPNLVVAPAFPAQGRTLVRGVVHIQGVPLRQTGFALDALSPPPLDPLEQVFRAAAPQAQVVSVPPGGPFDLARREDGLRVFVVDGEMDLDLQRTVTALRARLRDCVLVGSAGIATAVAQVCMTAGAPPPRPRLSGQTLIVVGSRAEQSATQVAALREQSGVALFDAPNGRLRDDGVFASQAPILVLRATPGAGGEEGDAAEVAARLARAVAIVLHNRAIAAVLATGGDTAIAILEALACPALQVMGDLLPGLPYCRLQLDGRVLWLVTKAGGFGTPDTLGEVVRILRGE